jgi:phosphate starvation-inducible membrane PsiE
MGRARDSVKLGYWSYLGLGSLVLLIVGLIEGSWSIAALSGVVLVLAIRRLYVLRAHRAE